VLLKQQYNDNRREMHDSMTRLAQADTYIRLTTRMCEPCQEEEGFTEEEPTWL
jgi:hypothetical protein